jgi:hypothetical protein
MAGLSGAVGLIAGVAAVVVVFVLLREFWCWYWKINQISDTLIKIEKKLSRLDQNGEKDV